MPWFYNLNTPWYFTTNYHTSGFLCVSDAGSRVQGLPHCAAFHLNNPPSLATQVYQKHNFWLCFNILPTLATFMCIKGMMELFKVTECFCAVQAHLNKSMLVGYIKGLKLSTKCINYIQVLFIKKANVYCLLTNWLVNLNNFNIA